MAFELVPDHSGFQGGSIGQAYNEAAFRYFLDVDRTRVQHSERSIVLALVSLRREVGQSAPIADASAAPLFAALAGSVREVDFIGWYRQDRVIGAVLPQGGRASDEDRRLISHRLVASLKTCLPADIARHLHVRVVCLSGKDHR